MISLIGEQTHLLVMGTFGAVTHKLGERLQQIPEQHVRSVRKSQIIGTAAGASGSLISGSGPELEETQDAHRGRVGNFIFFSSRYSLE